MRISELTYVPAYQALCGWLRSVLGRVVPLVEHGRRFTVMPNDVAYALKQMGWCVGWRLSCIAACLWILHALTASTSPCPQRRACCRTACRWLLPPAWVAHEWTS